MHIPEPMYHKKGELVPHTIDKKQYTKQNYMTEVRKITESAKHIVLNPDYKPAETGKQYQVNFSVIEWWEMLEYELEHTLTDTEKTETELEPQLRILREAIACGKKITESKQPFSGERQYAKTITDLLSGFVEKIISLSTNGSSAVEKLMQLLKDHSSRYRYIDVRITNSGLRSLANKFAPENLNTVIDRVNKEIGLLENALNALKAAPEVLDEKELKNVAASEAQETEQKKLLSRATRLTEKASKNPAEFERLTAQAWWQMLEVELDAELKDIEATQDQRDQAGEAILREAISLGKTIIPNGSNEEKLNNLNVMQGIERALKKFSTDGEKFKPYLVQDNPASAIVLKVVLNHLLRYRHIHNDIMSTLTFGTKFFAAGTLKAKGLPSIEEVMQSTDALIENLKNILATQKAEPEVPDEGTERSNIVSETEGAEAKLQTAEANLEKAKANLEKAKATLASTQKEIVKKQNSFTHKFLTILHGFFKRDKRVPYKPYESKKLKELKENSTSQEEEVDKASQQLESAKAAVEEAKQRESEKAAVEEIAAKHQAIIGQILESLPNRHRQWHALPTSPENQRSKALQYVEKALETAFSVNKTLLTEEQIPAVVLAINAKFAEKYICGTDDHFIYFEDAPDTRSAQPPAKAKESWSKWFAKLATSTINAASQPATTAYAVAFTAYEVAKDVPTQLYNGLGYLQNLGKSRLKQDCLNEEIKDIVCKALEKGSVALPACQIPNKEATQKPIPSLFMPPLDDSDDEAPLRSASSPSPGI
jgi:hypothetical protein